MYCAHEKTGALREICGHLSTNEDLVHVLWFRDGERQFRLICEACAEAGGTTDLRIVCEACFEDRDNSYNHAERKPLGMPRIAERPEPLSFSHKDFPVETKPVSAAPCGDGWVWADEAGNVRRLGSPEPVATGRVERPLLIGSEDGRFAALVPDRGLKGWVIDLENRKHSMLPERHDYHSNHCSWPIAFFEDEERTLLLHGTDWNRIDISDPSTGELLTERSPGEDSHNLDYFHAGLAVSPGGRHVSTSGWVWQPMGILRTWNLKTWLKENVWESEDGASVKTHNWTGYHWGGPMVWIDDRILAVWGYGTDDTNMIDAAVFYDAEKDERLRWFPGPAGQLGFSEYLFSFDAKSGTAVWDIDTGERLLNVEELRASAFHPANRELASLSDTSIRISRLR